MLNILVADDHALMREGIHLVLSRLSEEPELVSAANYAETLHFLTLKTDFDLILIDLNMPGGQAFTGLVQVLTASREVPVVVLSASDNPADIHRSIELGAKGYIPKSESNERLIAALELVLLGGVYLPPRLYNYTPASDHIKFKPENAELTLTRRQKEVLVLLARGEPNKGIGRILGLSEGTVRTHVNAIFKLLDVNNRTQAGVSARTLGLI